METTTSKTLKLLPMLDCGACGYKTCHHFATKVDLGKEMMKRCIHVADKIESKEDLKDCFICAKEEFEMGDKLGWKDR